MASPTDKRPRLWVPGLLWVSDERELEVGRHVGFNGWGSDFAHSPCGHFGTIADWRHSAWLVERKELSDAIVDEQAIILPERLVDPDRQPHARRWLAEQPLVCVSGAKSQRLIDAGLRVYRVAHGVAQPGWLEVEAAGGERASWRLEGMVEDFWPADLRDRGDDADALPATEHPAARVAIDRVLRFVSRDILAELSVLNAAAARRLVEPGYGYYGATDGSAASIERVQRNLRALDALFAQIHRRAADQRRDARQLVDALERAKDDDESVPVPVYDRARRLRLEELTIALSTSHEAGEGPRWITGERAREELVLPEQARWIVERVELWSPSLPTELRDALEREERRRALTRPSLLFAAAMVLALLALIAIALSKLL